MSNRGTDPQPDQPRPAGFWQRLPKGFWPGFISGLFALLIVGGLLAFFLSPELLKHHSSFPGEEAIGQSRVQAAIDGSYKDKANPVTSSAETLAAGRTVYNSNCAFCHGVTGAGEASIGKNMFPQAANLLSQNTVGKTDGQIYWILENGLAFVGMPAFKNSLSADDMWKAVVYIRQLQKGGVPTTAATAAAATATVAVTVGAPTTSAPTAAQTTAATATTQAPAATTAAYAATTAAQTAAATTAAATTSAAAATTAASGGSTADLAKGLAIFQTQGCAGCHGGDKATGGIGPALNNITFPFSGLLQQVRSGSGVMPAYPASALSDADAQMIYNYLKSLQS